MLDPATFGYGGLFYEIHPPRLVAHTWLAPLGTRSYAGCAVAR